jgi:hypothetical protein
MDSRLIQGRAMPSIQRAIDSNPKGTDGGSARTVCDITDIGFTDAIEIRQIVQALELQNQSEVSDALLAVGAGHAAVTIRNALIARLVLLVGRVYDHSGNGGLHISRAIELMKDAAVRSEIESRGSKDLLAESVKRWGKLKNDQRLGRIKQLRDRYTAHPGNFNNAIPALEFQALFDFARDTTAVMDTLARATGTRTQCLDSWDEELHESAAAFWQPWQSVHLVFERFRNQADSAGR